MHRFAYWFAIWTTLSKSNDRLGHEAGDSALKRVAQLVSGDLREFDVFARWGGEEFVALLPGINVEQGMETAERLRRLVERASVPQLGGALTISCGIAMWDRSEDVLALISRADDALYAAKASGKNRSQFGSQVKPLG